MNPEQRPPVGTTGTSNVIALVLAAGIGKRMGTDLPKVLLPFHGRPMVQWVVESAEASGIQRVIVVVGHKGDLVIEALNGYAVEFVWQREQLGTGHAVMQALDLIMSHGGPLLVLLGDVPGLRPKTIQELVAMHITRNASATILTAELADPSGYGRIVRGPNDTVTAIVEDRDASDKIKSIKEINTGLICFSTPHLIKTLGELRRDNSQGEYYLTDCVKLLVDGGLGVFGHLAENALETAGVNSPSQLAELERLISP